MAEVVADILDEACGVKENFGNDALRERVPSRSVLAAYRGR